MSDFSLDFRDTETAFADKTNSQLKEKYRLFRILNSPLLNSIGTGVTKFALALGLPVEGLIKSTVFEQFCGGETIEECETKIDELSSSGIGTILDYSVEGGVRQDPGRDHSNDRPREKRSQYSLRSFQGERDRASRNPRADESEEKTRREGSGKM